MVKPTHQKNSTPKAGIIIKTYYQKHKTIQAFQFDGTWQQLKQELPNQVWRNLIDEYNFWDKFNYLPKNEVCQIQYNHHHLIQTLLIDDSITWPQIKTHNKKLMYNHTKPVIAPRLHYHDYIIVRPLAYYRMHKHMFRHNFKIYFSNPSNFEAHWSSEPIKKN